MSAATDMRPIVVAKHRTARCRLLDALLSDGDRRNRADDDSLTKFDLLDCRRPRGQGEARRWSARGPITNNSVKSDKGDCQAADQRSSTQRLRECFVGSDDGNQADEPCPHTEIGHQQVATLNFRRRRTTPRIATRFNYQPIKGNVIAITDCQSGLTEKSDSGHSGSGLHGGPTGRPHQPARSWGPADSDIDRRAIGAPHARFEPWNAQV